MSEPTPRPWFIEGTKVMDEYRSRIICLFGESDQDEADAVVVVDAVNSHAGLVSALTAALARAEAAESALVTARAAIHELLDQREDRWNDYDETIRGLLAALFEPTTETCPECEGNSERSLGSGLFCKTCGEAGTVPGPPLAYLAVDIATGEEEER